LPLWFAVTERSAMPRPARDIAVAANLRTLCSLYPSVSEVARRLGVNRQQFTRYLAGESVPSLRNLRRITDFFGVDEFEILLPPREFSASVLPRRREAAASEAPAPAPGLAPVADGSQDYLAPYCGFYHVYFCTPVWSNHVVRALTRIQQRDGRTVSRSIERLRDNRSGRRDAPVQKFSGVVSQVVDRICILEHETAVRELSTMTVLYPSHRRALRLLTGVMSGIASGGGRQPFASRIVYDYLGRKTDIRAALQACGLFAFDDPAIPADIRERVANDVDPAAGVLLPRPY
jgi:transcriptional regulator with XRE-family HTH domain